MAPEPGGDDRAGPTPPALLVLAAGLGSRYGGAKQMEEVGPGGAWIMDYTIADAVRAGVRHVVVVVRPGIREEVASHLASFLGGAARLTLVDQELTTALPHDAALPTGRTKPWGTAHAVLAARDALSGAFVVANADDLYGAEAMRCLVAAMSTPPGEWALVGYRIADTLSDHGGVTRGLCAVGADDRLTRIEEAEDVARGEDGRIGGTVAGRPVVIAEDARVSMNLWRLDASIFPPLQALFAEFVQGTVVETGELLLPEAIGRIVDDGGARVRMLRCGEEWVGVTHPADRGRVARVLEGRGPPRLRD